MVGQQRLTERRVEFCISRYETTPVGTSLRKCNNHICLCTQTGYNILLNIDKLKSHGRIILKGLSDPTDLSELGRQILARNVSIAKKIRVGSQNRHRWKMQSRNVRKVW